MADADFRAQIKWHQDPNLVILRQEVRVLVLHTVEQCFANRQETEGRFDQVLPYLPIPLHPNDVPIVLDFPAIFAGIYHRGHYFSRLNYRQLPPPLPLTENDRTPASTTSF